MRAVRTSRTRSIRCSPAYANPRNEIGLDLTTGAAGAGSATATVGWGRNRRAGSVIIHAMPTAAGPGEAGVAGARAACITVEF